MKHCLTLASIILILLCTLTIGYSQTAPLTPHKPKTLFLPHNLGPNVNTEDYAEINPIISPDGKTLYFTRLDHPENTYGRYESHDAWYSELQADGTWGKAKRMSENINVGRYNSVLSIAADGKTILLNGKYTLRGRWKKRGLSTSIKTSVGWTKPENLRVPKFSRKSHGSSSNAFMNAKGDVMILAYTKKFSGHLLNLYVSRFVDGKWRKPKKMKGVNTRIHTEEAPFLSPDGKTLYFASHNRPNNLGKFDIYKCYRLDDSYRRWSEPKLLSDTINTLDWESYYKTNNKGSFAYFSSNHGIKETQNNQHRHSHADIFGVKLFEERPYVKFKGQIKNSKTKENLDIKYTYQIFVNNALADSVLIDRDSINYEIKLPLGKKYTIDARVKGFTYKTDSLDLSLLKEFEERTHNLEVTPIPYSEISGNVHQTGSINILPDSSKPKIMINGVIVDSININLTTGAYKVRLLNEKSYKIQVSAIGFESHPSILDLSHTTEYKTMHLDLSAEPKKAAKLIVSGIVIDKKTGKSINPSLPVQIIVNGMSTNATYYNATGEYSIELAQATDYTINATSSGYYPVYETIAKSENPHNIYIKRDLMITPIEVGQSVKINNIFFETGKANLKPASFSELNRVIKFLSENASIKIEIEGHTDNVGKADKNLALSKARAKAVAAYITDNGIDIARVTSIGYGSSKPVADNKTPVGKAANRRVEFKIVGK